MSNRPSANRLLSEEEVHLAQQLWEGGSSRKQIADTIGIPVWVFDIRRGDQLLHLKKCQGRGGGSWDRGISRDGKPHRDELAAIDRRREEVRDSWSMQERAFRRGYGLLPENYKPRSSRTWSIEPVRGSIPTSAIDAANNPRMW